MGSGKAQSVDEHAGWESYRPAAGRHSWAPDAFGCTAFSVKGESYVEQSDLLMLEHM
jgi:hypothetical protein